MGRSLKAKCYPIEAWNYTEASREVYLIVRKRNEVVFAEVKLCHDRAFRSPEGAQVSVHCARRPYRMSIPFRLHGHSR